MGITLREWSQQWLEVYVKPVDEKKEPCSPNGNTAPEKPITSR